MYTGIVCKLKITCKLFIGNIGNRNKKGQESKERHFFSATDFRSEYKSDTDRPLMVYLVYVN